MGSELDKGARKMKKGEWDTSDGEKNRGRSLVQRLNLGVNYRQKIKEVGRKRTVTTLLWGGGKKEYERKRKGKIIDEREEQGKTNLLRKGQEGEGRKKAVEKSFPV